MSALLNWMIWLPMVGAAICLIVPDQRSAKWVALVTSIVVFVFNLVLTAAYANLGWSGVQFETAIPWISALNVEYRVAVDGLSLPLLLLTTGLSILVVAASWSISKAVNAFMALYLVLLTGMMGVFCATDLFLFYVFFEISLLPMYFLIGVWGGPRKEYAAIKFFLYTLAGSICLLIVMLGFYLLTPQIPGASGNVWTLIAADPSAMTLQSDAVRQFFGNDGPYHTFGQWAFWLTFIAFLIKLPGVPFHTWLPDAHVEAPTPISMILAGVLLKMGGYALMRITYPIFPDAAQYFWMCVGGLGVLAIIYGAFCAMAQTDWKKLVAYSSVSHMGYVTLGLAVLTRTGWDGAYFQMIGHGITSAMMFFLVGVVYERAHHRDLERFGGLWLKWPGFGGWSLVGFFAAVGLPGMCGFIGEVMVLLGTFEAAGNPILIGGAGTADAASVAWWAYAFGGLAAFAVVLTAGYILWMFQRVYMGHAKPDYEHYQPVVAREYFIMSTLGAAAIVLGIVPVLVFMMTRPTFDQLVKILGLS